MARIPTTSHYERPLSHKSSSHSLLQLLLPTSWRADAPRGLWQGLVATCVPGVPLEPGPPERTRLSPCNIDICVGPRSPMLPGSKRLRLLRCSGQATCSSASKATGWLWMPLANGLPCHVTDRPQHNLSRSWWNQKTLSRLSGRIGISVATSCPLSDYQAPKIQGVEMW